MPKVYVTRRLHFSAAHRLHSQDLNEKENVQIYGLCNNPFGHGHNYEIEVTVAGEPNPKTGMVIDLKELKKIVNKNIINKVDHKHLNHDVDFMEGVIPTAENIAVVFWNVLKNKLYNCELVEIKLYETPRNIVIYKGE
jgi:6-pyruvoyltetrahydropterin/6-carboxytetrahydropterin synthase